VTSTNAQYRVAEHAVGMEGDNAVDVAEATFNLLVQGPAPLSLDGGDLGHGLPDRPIDLVELRTILLHPATDYPARDVVWAELVHRARENGATWVVGCLGIALPGLKAVLKRATWADNGQDRQRVDEAAAALVSGFYEGLLTIDTGRKAIGPRLLLRARKAAHRALGNGSVGTPVEPLALAQTIRPTATQRPTGHVDLVLAAAVQHGVISRLDASIIGTTRFENVDPRLVANQLGVGYEALMKRRRRAERRLATAIESGELGQVSDLMSSPGL
jgi:hypothetical protein